MKRVVLSLLFVVIVMPNQAVGFTQSIRNTLKYSPGITIITAGASSLLACFFFQQAAKEWARYPDEQDAYAAYERSQFIKGTTWFSLGIAWALLTKGIVHQNPTVHGFADEFVDCLCHLRLAK